MFFQKIATYFPISDPTWIFFVVLCIILLAPMILERLRLPAIIGMIFAGILVGPHGLHVLNRDSSFELFGKVGLYYIIFLASLEMNMQDIKKARNRALTLGVLSFLIPIVLGYFCNRNLLGYSIGASVLMAAMYASHTLISYPITIRYGLARHRTVNIAVGATIIADTLTLLVLAVVSGMYKGHYSGWHWVLLVVRVCLLGGGIVFFFPRLGRWFFRRYNDAVVQYIFVLCLLFLGAGLMEWVGMDGILGAFMVGLVLNRLIPPASPLMNHVEFVGNALFIPYLLIGVGMIIDLNLLFTHPALLYIPITMVVVAITGKWLSAYVTQKIFHMTVTSRNLIFGLTNSRAAATLAVVLVGHNIILADGSRLLDDTVLNGAMMLILISCIVSSIVTEHTARNIVLTYHVQNPTPKERAVNKKMLIALSNPETSEPLMHLALMMRSAKADAPMVALNVVLEDEPKKRGRGLRQLERAAQIAAAANIPLQTQSRWSVNVVSGIYHTMLETDAAEVLIGLHQKARISETFYGKLITDLLAAVQRQTMIYRPGIPLNTLRLIHIVMPAKAEYEAGFARWAERMARLSEQLGCKIALHGTRETLDQLEDVWKEKKFELEYTEYIFTDWRNMLTLANTVNSDHLIAFICARHGTLSYNTHFDLLPEQVERYFSANTLLMIYPDQYEAENNIL